MSGRIRQHRLLPNDPLDRRRMEEMYLEAARRFSQVEGFYLGDGQLRRAGFNLDSWEEMQASFQTSIQYKVPEMGHQLPGTGNDVINDDPYFEAKLYWAAEVTVGSNSSSMVMGWPTVDGQAVWAGEDYAVADQVLNTVLSGGAIVTSAGTPLTNGVTLTISNECVVKGLNGRSYLGVLVHSIGKFKITKARVNLRKVLR